MLERMTRRWGRAGLVLAAGLVAAAGSVALPPGVPHEMPESVPHATTPPPDEDGAPRARRPPEGEEEEDGGSGHPGGRVGAVGEMHVTPAARARTVQALRLRSDEGRLAALLDDAQPDPSRKGSPAGEGMRHDIDYQPAGAARGFVARIRTPSGQDVQMDALQAQKLLREGHPPRRQDMERLDAIAGRPDLLNEPRPSQVPFRQLEVSADGLRMTIRPGAIGPVETFTLPPVDFATSRRLRELLRSADDVLVGGGPLPPETATDLALSHPSPAYRARRDRPLDDAEYRAAIAKGNERITDKPWHVENALPHATGLSLPLMLKRMKLSLGQFGEWRRLAKVMAKLAWKGTTPRGPATRDTLLDAIRNGHDNVLVLIAHNDDGLIHFPDGRALELRKLAELTRDPVPDRAIVLISCETGGNHGAQLSLAETLAINGLARTVFAPEKVVDATQVPKIIQDLQERPLREAMAAFDHKQYVLETSHDHPRS